MYNYGSKEANHLKYGQDTPPEYDIAANTVETYLYSGTLDILADPDDVDFIRANKPNIKGDFVYTDFAHLDFIYGMKAATEVYERALGIIRQAENM